MNAFAPRRPTEPQISEAIRLGWRIAKLYSRRADDLERPPAENLLPMRRSLPPADRFELEMRAAAGDAARLGIGPEPDELEALVALARSAPESSAHLGDFLDRIRSWHIELQTMLWAEDEPAGKAYELGSFLSDTSNRVVRALHAADDPRADVTRELRRVFAARRVDRIKRLLDDLEARIDPAAVRIVRQHLMHWEAEVATREAACTERADLVPLDRQVITWFQLVSGDKEPEAYLDQEDRSRMRGTMLSRAIRSYACNWRCGLGVVVVLAALAGLAVALPHIRGRFDTGQLVAFAGPIAGALGISLASVGRTVRQSLDARAELLWNTALVEIISQKTLHVEVLLSAPQPRRTWQVAPASLRPPFAVAQRNRAA